MIFMDFMERLSAWNKLSAEFLNKWGFVSGKEAPPSGSQLLQDDFFDDFVQLVDTRNELIAELEKFNRVPEKFFESQKAEINRLAGLIDSQERKIIGFLKHNLKNIGLEFKVNSIRKMITTAYDVGNSSEECEPRFIDKHTS